MATTEKPLAMAGDFAFLKVVSVNPIGAFLDWGLPKDLLVPFSEQKAKMVQGNTYLVYIYLDLLTKRLVASAKVEKFLDNTPPDYQIGEEVNLLITQRKNTCKIISKPIYRILKQPCANLSLKSLTYN